MSGSETYDDLIRGALTIEVTRSVGTSWRRSDATGQRTFSSSSAQYDLDEYDPDSLIDVVDCIELKYRVASRTRIGTSTPSL